MRALLAGLLLLAALPAAEEEQGRALPDQAAIEKLTGLHGTMNTGEGVFKVTYPRADLAANVAGTRMTPALGLSCWAAFQRMADGAMVMGDLVLQEDQVPPVMDAALDNGLQVTALHNHFLFDAPRVMFMHIGGAGDERQLAAAVGKVFVRLRDTAGGKGSFPRADIDVSASRIEAAPLEKILGMKGQAAGGTFKVTVGRTILMHHARVGKEMGVNTWAAFAGTAEQAVVDGDFAVHEGELQAVLKALRKNGIAVVAIHNHMTFERPRIVFLHFWGVGKAVDLARGFREALDTTCEE